MNNSIKKNTKEKTAPFSDAVNEQTIYPKDLLEEIIPLLKDYFVGDFKTQNNAIIMEFFNGQKFRLSVGEIL